MTSYCILLWLVIIALIFTPKFLAIQTQFLTPLFIFSNHFIVNIEWCLVLFWFHYSFSFLNHCNFFQIFIKTFRKYVISYFAFSSIPRKHYNKLNTKLNNRWYAQLRNLANFQKKRQFDFHDLTRISPETRGTRSYK